MNELDVHLHDRSVGKLERAEQGRLRFIYAPAELSSRRLPPLSLSLPPRAEPFDDTECRGYFSGLLPEGGFLRSVARAFGVSAANPFSVLEAIGGECAGAVSLSATGENLPPPGRPKRLSVEALYELVADSPERVLTGGPEGEGLRLSLAGAQEKLPVMFGGGSIFLTAGDPPSTHIIKLPIDGFDDTVANENFCLCLAREAGLAAVDAHARDASPHSSIEGTDRDVPYLLVTRYDRTQGGPVRRIHQEDFCQALGFAPELKYEADGGPGVAACAELIGRHSAVPARDRLAFADALLFNFTIGNHDAHSKNFSLMLEGEGAVRMTPLYDLLSTAIYPGLSRKLAMSLGGENRPEYFEPRHLDRLATDLGMQPTALRRRAADLCDRVEATLPVAESEAGGCFADTTIMQRIKGQAGTGISRLRHAIGAAALGP